MKKRAEAFYYRAYIRSGNLDERKDPFELERAVDDLLISWTLYRELYQQQKKQSESESQTQDSTLIKRRNDLEQVYQDLIVYHISWHKQLLLDHQIAEADTLRARLSQNPEPDWPRAYQEDFGHTVNVRDSLADFMTRLRLDAMTMLIIRDDLGQAERRLDKLMLEMQEWPDSVREPLFDMHYNILNNRRDWRRANSLATERRKFWEGMYKPNSRQDTFQQWVYRSEWQVLWASSQTEQIYDSLHTEIPRHRSGDALRRQIEELFALFEQALAGFAACQQRFPEWYREGSKGRLEVRRLHAHAMHSYARNRDRWAALVELQAPIPCQVTSKLYLDADSLLPKMSQKENQNDVDQIVNRKINQAQHALCCGNVSTAKDYLNVAGIHLDTTPPANWLPEDYKDQQKLAHTNMRIYAQQGDTETTLQLITTWMNAWDSILGHYSRQFGMKDRVIYWNSIKPQLDEVALYVLWAAKELPDDPHCKLPPLAQAHPDALKLLPRLAQALTRYRELLYGLEKGVRTKQDKKAYIGDIRKNLRRIPYPAALMEIHRLEAHVDAAGILQFFRYYQACDSVFYQPQRRFTYYVGLTHTIDKFHTWVLPPLPVADEARMEKMIHKWTHKGNPLDDSALYGKEDPASETDHAENEQRLDSLRAVFRAEYHKLYLQLWKTWEDSLQALDNNTDSLRIYYVPSGIYTGINPLALVSRPDAPPSDSPGKAPPYQFVIDTSPLDIRRLAFVEDLDRWGTPIQAEGKSMNLTGLLLMMAVASLLIFQVRDMKLIQRSGFIGLAGLLYITPQWMQRPLVTIHYDGGTQSSDMYEKLQDSELTHRGLLGRIPLYRYHQVDVDEDNLQGILDQFGQAGMNPNVWMTFLHGKHDSTQRWIDPLRVPQIIFSDTILTARDVLQLNLRTIDVGCFNVCKLGHPDRIGRTHLEEFQFVFSRAGARNLLFSLNPYVPQKSSKYITIEIWAHYNAQPQGEKDVHAAWRKAVQEWRFREYEKDYPLEHDVYHWACMIPVGP